MHGIEMYLTVYNKMEYHPVLPLKTAMFIR